MKFTEKNETDKVEEIQLANLASLGGIASKNSKQCLGCFAGEEVIGILSVESARALVLWLILDIFCCKV